MDAPANPLGPWRITHVEMRIELPEGDDTGQRVAVRSQLHIEPVRGAAPGPLVLDGRGLQLVSVAIDDHEVAADGYTIDDSSLTLSLSAEPHVVRTEVTAGIGGPNDLGFTRRPPGLISTTLEPQGFRRITYFLDRPANRATFEVTLVGSSERYPTMLCNGHLIDAGFLPDGRQWMRYDDPITKPSYLFAMVAGPLASWTRPYITGSGREITIAIVAPRDQIDGADFGLDIMQRVLRFDEATGGIEPDLDVLTFVALPGYPDATEYHGLMFFESSVLVVDRRGYVDDDLLLIIANIAHEWGHHVRGNRVTVTSWGQLALKEGLTVLMGQNDARRELFGGVGRVLDVLDLRRLQFPEELTIGAPVVRGEVSDPSSLYTRTTYLKGAEIFGMLRTLLGPERWAEVFAAFVERFDLGAAGVDDFIEIAREFAPRRAADIDGIARWFGLVGRPALVISTATEHDAVTVDIRRTDSLHDDPPVAMPVALAFRTLDGAPLPTRVDGGKPVTEHVHVLRGREGRVSLQADQAVVLSPLRGYSAPVDLAVSMPAEHLASLMVHDDDPFARWWAGEELMIRVVDAHRRGRETTAHGTFAVLADGLQRVAATEQDPMLLAQLLAVPDEFMLGDREPQIDVDGVAAGLDHLRVELGMALHDSLLDVLDRFSGDNVGGDEPSDIAIRSLVEPVLALLLATGSDAAAQASLTQLASANPTRAVRALTQLAHYDEVPLDDLLAATYDQWQFAPKLVDRWLRAQSGARRSDTIERVVALAHGPLYDRNDRSRVMAVWFPFATRNRSVFHHPSGAGYRAFVDELGELLPRNAGLAVRLVGDLLQFRRFDANRQALLRAELERMVTMPGMPDFAVGIVRGLLDRP
ncbi:MAG: aminopeptidase N C-terminal domain-containing protein [Actinobacteria bacterium]|nr:aminopeptidase N C-terminal domain-containing protein [Actinomycetota bacterium]